MTNKSLTGPNRGYACGHLYFETEGMMDRLAERLGLDPVEVRRRNLIPRRAVPVPHADGRALRQRRLSGARSTRRSRSPSTTSCARSRRQARAAGRYVGIGLALAVDPVRLEHGLRGDRARPAVPRQARVPAEVGRDRVGHGQGRSARPRDRRSSAPRRRGRATRRSCRRSWPTSSGSRPTTSRWSTRWTPSRASWSISSGTYSSRFGSVGTSAVAARRAQAQGQARGVRRAPDGRARRRARVPRRRRAPAAGKGAVVLGQGPGRARALEHEVAARRHGAGPAGDRGVRLHGREGGRRRGPRELVEHLRVHRRGDGGRGRSRAPRRSRSSATSPCTTRARSSTR